MRKNRTALLAAMSLIFLCGCSKGGAVTEAPLSPTAPAVTPSPTAPVAIEKDENFMQNIRRAAAYAFDAKLQQFFEAEMPLVEDVLWYADVSDENAQKKYEEYLLEREKNLSEESVNASFDNGLLSPKEWVNSGLTAYSGDLLTLESKDDGIYLTIYRDDWSEEMHDEYPTFEYAKAYRLDGLYKNYTEARISWGGNGKQPYILLLSDDGMIACVDVWEGLVTGHFCAVEPLWGLTNLTAFSDEVEYRIAAVNRDGKLIDVEDALYMLLISK